MRLACVCPAAQPEVGALVPARNRACAWVGLRIVGSWIVVTVSAPLGGGNSFRGPELPNVSPAPK